MSEKYGGLADDRLFSTTETNKYHILQNYSYAQKDVVFMRFEYLIYARESSHFSQSIYKIIFIIWRTLKFNSLRPEIIVHHYIKLSIFLLSDDSEFWP